MEKLIIVGTSTNAHMAYEFNKMHRLYEVVGFAVNREYRNIETLYDLPVYCLEDLHQHYATTEVKLFVALLWNRLNSDRRKLYEYCKTLGYGIANLISPLTAVRSEIAGDNVWIQDFVVVQHNTKIGSDVVIMSHSLVGANSQIGDHCFLGAHSVVGGGTNIGEQSFLGLNATVFDGTTVGRKCIVGACSAVKRNMPDFSKCSTPTSDVVIKQYDEDEIEGKLLFRKNIR